MSRGIDDWLRQDYQWPDMYDGLAIALVSVHSLDQFSVCWTKNRAQAVECGCGYGLVLCRSGCRIGYPDREGHPRRC